MTRETVIETLKTPDQILYDTQTERYIAINKDHRSAIIYEKKGEEILIITIIYSSTLMNVVERLRRSGRWI